MKIIMPESLVSLRRSAHIEGVAIGHWTNILGEDNMARTATKANKGKSPAVRNTKRTAKNATTRAKAVKAPTTVPGFPRVERVIGKGVTDRTIASIIRVNKSDNGALLNNGSVHSCDAHLKAGVICKRGMNWDSVNKDLLAMQRSEKAAAPKAAAVLAKGTETETHCRKAVADSKRGTKAAPAKADKKAARKAERAAKAAPKADDTRKITVKDKKFVFGGEGTARRACWDAVKTGRTVAEYVAAGGKVKYLPRWVAAGAITLA